MLILVIGLLGLSSEGLDRLWHAHLLAHFTFPDIGRLQGPVPWFGALGAASLVLGLIVTETIQRRIDVENTGRALRAQFALNLVMVVSVVVFGVATRLPVALLAILAVQVFRGANGPLYRAWINKQIEPRVRATVLSMNGQVDAIGQVLGGPGMGWLATAYSTRATMVAVAILLSPASTAWSRPRQQPDGGGHGGNIGSRGGRATSVTAFAPRTAAPRPSPHWRASRQGPG